MQLLASFTWLFVASLLLGLVLGMVSAALVRWLFPSPSPDREVLVVGLMGECHCVRGQGWMVGTCVHMLRG